MSIRFRCECGQAMKMADEHAGKRAKCPACGKVLTVPMVTDAAQAAAPAGPALSPKPPAPAPAARKPARPTAVSADDFHDHQEEPAAPAPSTAIRCPGCGKQLSAGARICITCGFDVASGKSHTTRAGSKERAIAGTSERGPWFSFLGIEFTTAKLFVAGLFLAAVLGLYFLVLEPAKTSRAAYDALTKKHDRALLQMVNAKLAEVGPQNTTVVNIWFEEPMFMLSVPAELAFSGHVADRGTSIAVETMSGWYDYKTGQLKLRLPNSSVERKIDVTAFVSPDDDGLGGVTAKTPASPPVRPPSPPVKPVRPDAPLVEGSTSWDLENKSVVAVQLTPWPARAVAPTKITVSAGVIDRAAAFAGKVWYRVTAEEVSTAEWIEMKATLAGTLELDAQFEAEAMLPAGKTFVQLKVIREGDANPTELTDFSILVAE